MNKNCIFCLSVLILIPLTNSLSSSSSASISFLGIPPKDEDYFKAEVVKCRNGSKKFPRAQLNDDFCDCPDATDEPGCRDIGLPTREVLLSECWVSTYINILFKSERWDLCIMAYSCGRYYKYNNAREEE